MAMAEAETREFQQFQLTWDQRINEKEQENARVIAEFQDRQRLELEEYRKTAEAKVSTLFKASAELLNLRQI